MPVAVLSPRRGYLKLLKESVRGTPIAATVSMPVDSRSIQGKWTRVKPDYMNNSVHIQREVAAGRRAAQGDFSGPVLSDSIGNLLMAIFGQDTLTGAGPYTHTFAPITTTPSYSIEKNAGGLSGATSSEQFSNAVCNRLTISGQVDRDDAVLQYQSSWLAKAPTKITATAWTQPTTKVIPAPLTVYENPKGTPVNDLLCEFSVTFEREADFVKGANNSLDISDAVATGFRASGYVDIYFLDYAAYDQFVANTQLSFGVLTALAAGESLRINSTQLYWDDRNLEEGQIFIKQRFALAPIFNATDAGSMTAILINGQSTAY